MAEILWNLIRQRFYQMGFIPPAWLLAPPLLVSRAWMVWPLVQYNVVVATGMRIAWKTRFLFCQTVFILLASGILYRSVFRSSLIRLIQVYFGGTRCTIRWIGRFSRQLCGSRLGSSMYTNEPLYFFINSSLYLWLVSALLRMVLFGCDFPRI